LKQAAEPGIVLAFETPYYIKGLGGIIIEHQILITENGIEVMAASPDIAYGTTLRSNPISA
jgi:Xaa-Pro aminopeptidase